MRRAVVFNHSDDAARVMATRAENYPKNDATRAVLESLIGNRMFISRGEQ
jgi:hypothetical protein